MILRTCPYNKRDGTRCNSLAMNGYDGCYSHSRILVTQGRPTRLIRLLSSAAGRLSRRTLIRIAVEVGAEPPWVTKQKRGIASPSATVHQEHHGVDRCRLTPHSSAAPGTPLP